ncbi:MAG: hypothetical protein RLZZ232_3835 [Planctomycetota bacterium]|jgi:excisionase family DNA binding protein
MAKKYLSLEEAASLLGLTVEQVRKAREQNELRGFSDRGSWKFREQDIEEYRRSREADSSPDMPILSADDDGTLKLSASDSDVRLMADDLSFDEDDVKGLAGTGSDIRLSGDSGPQLGSGTGKPTAKDISLSDSDSDVRLAEEDDFSATIELPVSSLDSDSDVKLFGAADLLASDSDSEVKLAGGSDRTDSDIRLADSPRGKGGIGLSPEDSDLKLLNRGSSTRAGQPDSGISLDVRGSGLNLNSDESGISLELDSGISLEADDSGISLESYDGRGALADDSGISLDAGDSGISLDLDDVASPAPVDMSRTMPMQAVPAARKSLGDSGRTTELEVPTAGGRDSEFELAGLDDDDAVGTSTSVLTFDDEDVAASKTVAASALSSSSVEDEVYSDSDELAGDEEYDEESYDEYDAESADLDGDEEGFEVGTTSVTGVAAGFARRADVDWGIPVKTMIGLSAVLSVLCAVVGIELMRTMWIWTQPGADAPASAVLDLLGNLF